MGAGSPQRRKGRGGRRLYVYPATDHARSTIVSAKLPGRVDGYGRPRDYLNVVVTKNKRHIQSRTVSEDPFRPPSPFAIARLRELRFAALDFETATEERGSACAIGVAVVENGQLVRSESWLVRPPRNQYSPWNIAIHGIEPHHTARAGEFPEVWRQAADVIGDHPIVAHNVSFDLGVLRRSLEVYGASCEVAAVYCSLMLSRRVWPGLMSYSLPPLARLLGIDVRKHHDAREDAIACAELVRQMCAAREVDDLQSLAVLLGFTAASLNGGVWTPCRIPSAHASFEKLEPVGDIDPEHALHGCRIAFTGTLLAMTRMEAAQRVVNAGGQPVTSVSKLTDYLVFGEQDFSKFVDGEMSSKTRKAAELVKQGHSLEIISERDFLRMVAS